MEEQLGKRGSVLGCLSSITRSWIWVPQTTKHKKELVQNIKSYIVTHPWDSRNMSSRPVWTISGSLSQTTAKQKAAPCSSMHVSNKFPWHCGPSWSTEVQSGQIWPFLATIPDHSMVSTVWFQYLFYAPSLPQSVFLDNALKMSLWHGLSMTKKPFNHVKKNCSIFHVYLMW